MDPAWREVGVEAGVDIVAAVERGHEALRPRVVLGGQVFLLRHLAAVGHVRGLVEQVLLQSVVWVLYFVGCGSWELLGLGFSLLDQRLLVLDFGVDGRVQLAVVAHDLQGLVLVGAHRVLQSQLSVAL